MTAPEDGGSRSPFPSSPEESPPSPPVAPVSSNGVRTALWGFCGITALWGLALIPFVAIPLVGRKRFGGLPWLPTGLKRIRAVFDYLGPLHVGPGKRFIDLGSGDGVAVMEAARRGAQAVGIELNPSLYLMSQVRSLEWKLGDRTGYEEGGRCRFVCGDLFPFPVSSYDTIMIFGTPQLMPRIRDKLEQEVSTPIYIFSHKFRIPGWEHILETTINDVHLYKYAPPQSNAPPRKDLLQ